MSKDTGTHEAQQQERDGRNGMGETCETNGHLYSESKPDECMVCGLVKGGSIPPRPIGVVTDCDLKFIQRDFHEVFPYLKPGESVVECVKRNRGEMLLMTRKYGETLIRAEKAEAERDALKAEVSRGASREMALEQAVEAERAEVEQLKAKAAWPKGHG